MAMINDKGPEESRDTDATYIILSHQSVHLPGPSRQRGGGASACACVCVMGGGGGGAGDEGGRQRRKTEGEKERESYLVPVLCTEELLFCLSRVSGKKEKQVTKR